MTMTDQIVISVAVVIVAIGYFCVGVVVMQSKVLKWRIKCIELEHDLARLGKREPRNIDDL